MRLTLIQILLMLFIPLNGCKSSPKPKTEIINLNGIQYDTLFLYQVGEQCGEWGGDKYKVKIFRQKSDKKLVAELNVSRMQCDHNGITDLPDTSFLKSIAIMESDEALIQDCLIELIRFRMRNDEMVGHSGIGNAAWRSDSSFTLRDYPSGKWTSFNKLIEKFEKR